MITLPDFKQKQILFIRADTNVSNKIKFHNDNIVFEKDERVVNRISCHRTFTVFIIGNISITSEIIKYGLKYGISFFFMKNNFEVYASINAVAEGNYLIRMRQYSLLENEELQIAKNIVLNKIKNQLSLLQSKKKSIPRNEKEIEKIIKISKNSDSLRGIEGNIAKEFFSSYFKEIHWFARMPRVKPDIPNFLLDVGYTVLFNFINALLNLFGFDTYKGCYHKLFFQRKSLACDIIEPFRGIIDREVLKIFNLKIINEKDFGIKSNKIYISFEKNKKYAAIFLESIMKNREAIYKYVQRFYRFLMDSEKNKFPYFKISR